MGSWVRSLRFAFAFPLSLADGLEADDGAECLVDVTERGKGRGTVGGSPCS